VKPLLTEHAEFELPEPPVKVLPPPPELVLAFVVVVVVVVVVLAVVVKILGSEVEAKTGVHATARMLFPNASLVMEKAHAATHCTSNTSDMRMREAVAVY
jgi:hypothetical protein